MKYLVLDIGGSAIKYALMTEQLEFLEKGNRKTPRDNIENFVNVIGEIYDKYKDIIEGVAISMPGCLDSEKGYTYTGGSLTYNDGKEIVKILQERCPTKMVIENDGKCAALAEVWKGSLKEYDNGVVIVLGTAVGGGIIINKKVYKGKNFFAGEFSFVATNIKDAQNKENRWGSKSGSEALLSAAAKAKNMQIEELDGYKVFEYANNKDEDILKVLDDFTYNLAVEIFNLQCIFDPEVVAIGGGISSQDILIEYIQKNMDKYHKHFEVKLPKTNIVRCEFRNEANLIGALYNFIIRS